MSTPVDFALKHIAETKHLLEKLIVSSETFDYPQAKRTIQLLQRKVRELGSFKAELEHLRAAPPQNVCAVNFCDQLR